jgi:hypothetical protein
MRELRDGFRLLNVMNIGRSPSLNLLNSSKICFPSTFDAFLLPHRPAASSSNFLLSLPMLSPRNNPSSRGRVRFVVCVDSFVRVQDKCNPQFGITDQISSAQSTDILITKSPHTIPTNFRYPYRKVSSLAENHNPQAHLDYSNLK